MKNDLKNYLNKAVVVDTATSWIYIGTLDKITDHTLILSDVDAHDHADSSSSREFYILESKTTGIRANRQSVSVVLSHVTSISLLEEIKEF